MSRFVQMLIGLGMVLPFQMGLLPASWAQENPQGAPPNQDVLLLSLREVVEDTLRNNITIAVEEFNSRIKKQDIADRKSEFDPTVSAEISLQEKTSQVSSAFAAPNKSRNLDHTWDFSLSQKVVTGGDYNLSFNNARNKTNSSFAGLNPQYSSDLEFSFTQPMLKNFGIDNNKRNIYIASNDVKISDFDFENKVIETVTGVENVYWDLVFSIEDLKVKEKSLQRARDLEKKVRAQVRVGTLAPLEILQAKSEVASREQLLLQARNLIDDNEDNLKNIINIRFSSPEGRKRIQPADKPGFSAKEEISLENALKKALKKRPDYLSRKKTLENQNILVKYNENQVYPSVDLVGSLGLNGISGNAVRIAGFGGAGGQSPFGGGYDETLANLFSTQFFKWQVGVKFSYPLGNRSAKSRLTASRLQVAQTLLDLKDLEKKIVVEVREAVRQIKTDIKRVQAARVARKLAEEKLSAEEKKFEVGMSTSFNILEFQEDLAEEQSNEIKAIIDYNKSIIQLRKVMATTLDAHNIKMSSQKDS
ncbi:MAG: TolC family protein [Nitrospinaceae bacterium]